MTTILALALLLVIKHYKDYKTRKLDEQLQTVEVAFK